MTTDRSGRRFIPLVFGCLAFLTAVLWSLTLIATVAAVLGVITILMASAAAVSWFRVRPRTGVSHIGLALCVVALLPAVSVAIQLVTNL